MTRGQNERERFKPGERVRSRKVGGIKSFIGIVTERRAGGYAVLDPQTGKVVQRDWRELSEPQLEASDHQL